MTEGEACRYTPSMIKSLLAGMMVAAVCAVQAGEYGDSAVRAARGEKEEAYVDSGSELITKENMYTEENQKLLFPVGE